MKYHVYARWLVVLLLGGGLLMPFNQAYAARRNLFSILGGAVSPITPQQEVYAGVQLDKNIREHYPPSENYALQAYVSDVGKRIAAVTNANYPFTYTVLADTRTANAFSGPGGFIYVTTGLLNMTENEAQLAAVLAHETAHVTLRHVVKQLQEKNGASLALLILSRVTSVDLENTIGQMGEYLLFQKFSRQDEYEADQVGTSYMVKAGYNPQGMVQLLDKLNALESNGVVISFLQSHPSSEDRARLVSEYIQRNHLEKPNQVLDTPLFHQIIR